jgi:hypothetical protein
VLLTFKDPDNYILTGTGSLASFVNKFFLLSLFLVIAFRARL